MWWDHNRSTNCGKYLDIIVALFDYQELTHTIQKEALPPHLGYAIEECDDNE